MVSRLELLVQSRKFWTGVLPTLALSTILLIDDALEWSERRFLTAAVADETAHLLTALLIITALPRRLSPVTIASTLATAVLIDLDHVPLLLGSNLLTQQTGRPVTHAMWTVALALTLAVTTGDRVRSALIGVSLGLITHFVRDVASTSAGVPLLWPLSSHGFTIRYAVYGTVLFACWATLSWRVMPDSQVMMDATQPLDNERDIAS